MCSPQFFRRQKAEGRRQKAEGRRKAEGSIGFSVQFFTLFGYFC
ncbi:hypothetical protein [[Phormidium ambiguum] IAM M-71]|nr:hypothetical protein [Phormidium ambiguum]